MKMLVAGQWLEKSEKIEVRNPYDGTVVDTVPRATAADVEAALAAAVEGAKIMRAMPGYERYRILRKAADLIAERAEQLARLISVEEGKILGESRVEVIRARETFELSSEEAKRLGGEVLPLDGASHGGRHFGFTMRVPCGVVVAIAPFNFPLMLPAHKVGPALAAGNSVILKPAGNTPLTSLALAEILLDAGLPPQAISCLTGPGSVLGDQLCSDPRVRKVSFTGSRDVGEHICKVAGIKRVTMELGSNAPVIVMDDADLDQAAAAIAATGFSNAGQVCISTQRVLAPPRIYNDLVDALKPRVEAITVGNQLEPQTKMGPMIREADAVRVGQWIAEAKSSGAQVVVGGERRGTLHSATLVVNVDPAMKVSCQELFGPAVAVTKVEDFKQAIQQANDSPYGLSAAIFTRDIDRALTFAREVDAGNLHINWGSQWRADLMPYGGLKESGLGKEGPKYAVQEMTELKTVIIHPPAAPAQKPAGK